MSDNPTVNRALKDKAMDHIDHALGRPAWPLRESYRNYFAVSPDSDEARAFRASPHWEAGGTIPDSLIYFCVTKAGREALAEHLRSLRADRVYMVTFEGFNTIVPAATRAKARYQKWVDLRDVLPALTFSEFQRAATVRLAQ